MAYDIFLRTFLKILDKYAPLKKSCNNNNYDNNMIPKDY